jgi:hypothetical protein
MGITDGTAVTNQYDSTGRDWYRAYGNKSIAAFRVVNENAEKIFHGGQDSVYPFISASIDNSNWYDITEAGTITADTPSDTDLFSAAKMDGWSCFAVAEAVSQLTRVINTGSWSKRGSETIIDQKMAKLDALANRIGYFFERSVLDGDGSNNTILGMSQLFDITNATYSSFDLTSATYKPYNVTIAVNQNSLTFDNLLDVYGELETEGMKVDTILSHKNAIKKMRSLSQATVEYSAGGNVTVGHSRFDVLGAKIVPCDYMPTTTSTKIYFINWGNHPHYGGPDGKDNPKVGRGNYWLMEYAGPAPLGYELIGWIPRHDYKGEVEQMQAWGAFKMICLAPERQGYISIA